MSDPFALIAAIFSAIATGIAAYATWAAPQSAAKLAESLREDAERIQERHRSRLRVFTTLMQERAAIYSEAGVGALNIIDVVFYDSRPVREAWSQLFMVFALKPLPDHLLEERLRTLLTAMANEIGLGGDLRTDDIKRVYEPRPISQDRLIKQMQRDQSIATLTAQGSPAANTSQISPWPPSP